MHKKSIIFTNGVGRKIPVKEVISREVINGNKSIILNTDNEYSEVLKAKSNESFVQLPNFYK